ncbi:hypothetical protein WR25_19512 [Diploscapter pachys]|uniref:Uncharacterized protein n=1 Tax=Diploscapter pachys TaxID=2018661 RepID=A0A2A2KH27_9BILA|nr:hypothetical protein WR25_19512 [Diploscapter pachys]
MQVRLIIAADPIAEPAQHRSLAAVLATAPREEQAFAAEQCAAHTADRDEVELNRRRHRGKAAGVDVQFLARRQRPLDDGAAHLDEDPAIAGQRLHHEAFAPEQPGHDPPLEIDAELHALRRGEECVLLADQLPAQVRQAQRHDRARRRRGEGDARLAVPLMREDRGEQAFARDQSLPRAEQLAHEAAAARAAAVTEDGGHRDAGVLPHHCARLCDRAFAGVELDLQELQFLALDLIVDLVRHARSALLLPGTFIGHGSSSSSGDAPLYHACKNQCE